MSEETLHSLAKKGGIVRAGATRDPYQRRRDYVYDRKFNYSGTMFCAKVFNMTASENKLLENHYRDNLQGKSNMPAQEGPGWVYLIKEK